MEAEKARTFVGQRSWKATWWTPHTWSPLRWADYFTYLESVKVSRLFLFCWKQLAQHVFFFMWRSIWWILCFLYFFWLNFFDIFGTFQLVKKPTSFIYVVVAGEEALRLPANSTCLRRVGEQDGDQVEGGEHHQVKHFLKRLKILNYFKTYKLENIFFKKGLK